VKRAWPEHWANAGHMALSYTTWGEEGKGVEGRGGTGWVGTPVGQHSQAGSTSNQAARRQTH